MKPKTFLNKYILKPKLYFSSTEADLMKITITQDFDKYSGEQLKYKVFFKFNSSILKFKGIEPLFLNLEDRYRKISLRSITRK